MEEKQVYSHNKSQTIQWESLGEARLRKEGAARAFIALEDMLQSIEILEKNSARRYKLLKYLVLSGKKNLSFIMDHGDLPDFKYRFEGGILYVNGEEADMKVVRK